MYNEKLEYLKSYIPEEVVNEDDVIKRKKTYPFLRLALMIANPYHLHIVRKIEPPKNRKIIYCPTHGFKDDFLNSVITIGKPAYTLFGSIDQFYNTIDGILAHMFGVVIVDRDDPKSRKSAQPKMERVFDYDINEIIFPEGAWNLTDNEIVMKLFNLVYDLARKENALVVPVATHTKVKEYSGKLGHMVELLRKTPIFKRLGRHCYSIQDPAIDIARIGSYEEFKASVELESRFTAVRTTKTENLSYKDIIRQIKPLVEEEDNTDLSTSNSYKLVKGIYNIANHYWKKHHIDDERMDNIATLTEQWIEAKRNNYVDLMDRTTELEEYLSSIFEKLPYRIGREKAKEELRNKMATPKIELMEAHSSFNREILEKGDKALKDQWENEVRRLKGEVEYYIEEKEKNYPYKDKNIISDVQAFSALDVVEPTKSNAYVLAKTRSQKK